MTNPTPPWQVPEALIYAELPKHAATGLGEEYESFDQNGKPMGKAYQNLVYYTEDQMRAFADATHALRITHVQNPAEIEHIAGDVSKNRSESNMAQQPAPSAASKAVLAAIRAANMQLVRTGDDEFMLVTLKQATPQADSHPAPVLLSDEELCKIEEPYLLNFRIPLGGQYDFARAVEKAVLAKTYVEAQAREIEGLRKQDDALIQQMHDALCECAEDSQEQLDRMEAAKLRQYKPQAVAYQEATIDAAKRAITAGRARLEGKP